ncbi:hypothetical protein DB44_BY00200 [Candidatus Protochlamydia amoebophila]|uniref:Uncharacterized protein n=2 Tax=Candidatus Protochlamydia amoebophila TaxID=362787 RepID=A0A0C1K050_9BACT|nr:hypothetical protein DB44_BY00200 [Candidatus Protochlamydia amoebophila]
MIMSSSIELVADGILFSNFYLNSIFLKEIIKNCASILTCTFGILEICNLYQISKGRHLLNALFSTNIGISKIHIFSIICSKISLILSAVASRPGFALITEVSYYFFSPLQMEVYFGPNTIFEVNPWHPRHVISILAVCFACPILLQLFYQSFRRINLFINKYFQCQMTETSSTRRLTDAKETFIWFFNFLASRPILHIGNQCAQFLL